MSFYQTIPQKIQEADRVPIEMIKNAILSKARSEFEIINFRNIKDYHKRVREITQQVIDNLFKDI